MRIGAFFSLPCVLPVRSHARNDGRSSNSLERDGAEGLLAKDLPLLHHRGLGGSHYFGRISGDYQFGEAVLATAKTTTFVGAKTLPRSRNTYIGAHCHKNIQPTESVPHWVTPGWLWVAWWHIGDLQLELTP